MSEPQSATIQKEWRDKHITQWTKRDVSEWIQKLGPMKQYANNFMNMDGAKLLQLTDEELYGLIPKQTVCKAFKRKITKKKDEDVLHLNHNDDAKYDDQVIHSNIVGLSNLGNTCYLNSTIQALLSSKEFVEHFRNHQQQVSNNNHKLLRYWSDLCMNTATTTKPKVFSPHKFRNALSQIDDRWGDGAQDDSIFVLFNILQVLDKQINQEQQYQDPCNEQKYAFNGEICIDNMENDCEFDACAENNLMKRIISSYNPMDHNIVRRVFDGILCEESMCGTCKYREKKYNPFRFIRLPLKSSIMVLQDIHIYIPQKFQNEPLTMKHCELLSYCSVSTLKYQIQQFICSEYTLSVSLSNIEIGAFKSSNFKNIDKMVKFMNDNDKCNALTDKTFAMVSLSNSGAQFVAMIHFKITNDDCNILFEFRNIPKGTKINENLLRETSIQSDYKASYSTGVYGKYSVRLNDKVGNNSFHPLFYVHTDFVDTDRVCSVSDRTRVILVIWIDLKAFDFARNQLENIAKYKNDASVNHLKNIIGYIDRWNILNLRKDEHITDYVFKSLNSKFKNNYKYDTKKSFDHITDSLCEYLRFVVLDADAFALYCKRCNNYSSIIERRRRIMVAPRSLIIFIDRCSGPNTLYKLLDEIEYNIKRLEIAESTAKKGTAVYDLTAVINHSGSFRGGHYTANVQSVHDRHLWFYTSDSYTSRISIDSIIDKDSMVLVYEKKQF